MIIRSLGGCDGVLGAQENTSSKCVTWLFLFVPFLGGRMVVLAVGGIEKNANPLVIGCMLEI